MNERQPAHLSLFTGIGGLDLAAEWAGFKTVGQCEWADYPTKVLEKHWPNVPRWRDIRTLNKEDFYARTGRRTVDVISGGFPCQPFSVAGKQKGKEDDRFLWPEMLRVIGELAPRWVIGENVPGILSIAAADIVKDLERLGYDVVVFAFEAAAVGARHRRERIFFVANARSDGRITGSDHREERRVPNDAERDAAEGQPARNRRINWACAAGAARAGESLVCDTERAGFSGEPRRRAGTESADGYLGMEERDAADPENTDERIPFGSKEKNPESCGASAVPNSKSERRGARRAEPAREQGGFDAEFSGASIFNPTCKRCGEARTDSERSSERTSGGGNVSDRDSAGLEGRAGDQLQGQCERPSGFYRGCSGNWWSIEPDVGRITHGVPEGLGANINPWAGDWERDVPRVAFGVKNRVEQLKAYGNAVVPPQAYPIFKAIYEIIKSQEET